MPDGSWTLLVSLIILIVFSGIFSGIETAFTSASKTKLKTLISNGNKKAEKVLTLANTNYDRLLSTILIGNNIVNLSASAISTILFAKLFINSKIDTTFLSTIVVTISVLIVGEITPKFIAKTYPEKIALLSYNFIMLFYYILYPFNLLFSFWKYLLSKIFKLNNTEKITEDEIITFVEEAQSDGTLKQDETKLIKSVIEFDDLEVEDILTPRVNLSSVEVDATKEEIAQTFRETGFSRLPVYKDSIDSIIGVIHEKDFYNFYKNGTKSLKEIMQEAYFTTQHTKISKLLRTLQAKRLQMAIVLDEYGGTLGIVTIEDILEELVGEIYDEHDQEITFHKKLNEHHFLFDGNAPIDKAFEILNIDNDVSDTFDASTVSGWVIEMLGEIPQVGKEFSYENFKIKILKANIKKVLQISILKDEQEALWY